MNLISMRAVLSVLVCGLFPGLAAAKDDICDTPLLRTMDADGTSSMYQHDMDIFRLRHIQTIGGYIEQYFEITGKYPLAGESKVPNYVFIATDFQMQYVPAKVPPFRHRRTPVEDLEETLRVALGNEIQIPFNKQKVPVHKPNFYTYMVRGDHYILEANLHGEYSFTHREDKYDHKVSISSLHPQDARYWQYGALIQDAGFVNAINRELCK